MQFLKTILFLLIFTTTDAQSFNYTQISEDVHITAKFFEDFNNDGIKDIIAHKTTNSIYELVFYQGTESIDLDQRFKQTFRIEIPSLELEFVLGDFDGDEDLDLVSIENDTYEFFLVRNDTDQFTIKKYGDVGHLIPQIWSGDYNNDGKDDLFNNFNSTSGSDSLHVLEFLSDTLSNNIAIMQIEKYDLFEVYNINNDEPLEILGYDKQNKVLDLFTLDSLEVLNLNTFEDFNYSNNIPISYGLHDFDKNGNIDLIYVDGTNLKCIYDFEIDLGQTPKNIDTLESFASFWLLDYTLDRKKDLIVRNTEWFPKLTGDFYHYINDGQNINKIPIQFNEAILGVEYLETNPITKKLLCFLRADNTTLLGEIIVNDDSSVDLFTHPEFNPWLPTEFLEATVTDVNQDGFDDILYHSSGGNLEIGVMYNDGEANYSNRQIIVDEIIFPRTAKFEDFNNDGAMDIVYHSIRNNDFVILYNINGSFVEIARYERAGYIITDFNQDNYKDIIFTLSGSNSENWFFEGLKNNAGSSFSFVEFGEFPITGRSIKEDFDQDGKDEIVYGILWDTEYSIHHIENQTIQRNIYPSLGTWHYVTHFDLDEDKPSELIAANRDHESDTYDISIYGFENNSNQFELRAKTTDLAGNYPEGFIYHDYDNDGFQDLITYRGNSSFKLYDFDGDTITYKGELNNYIDFDETIKPKHHTLLDSKNGVNRYLIPTDNEVYILNGTKKADITICTYFDENGNNEKDDNESYIPSSEIKFSNDQNTSTYTTQNSGCTVASINEGKYKIDLNPISCLSYNYNDSIDIELGSSYEIPLVQNNEVGSVHIDLTRAHTRCSFLSNYWIELSNNTCSDFSGELEIYIEENSPYIETILGGELIGSNTLKYTVENLPAGAKIKYEALIEMPNANFIGDPLEDIILLSDNTGDTISSIELPYILRCAYDPNDKSVKPDRTVEYGDQYVLNEDIEYLIRFENVGNDSAINIKVIDTISENLNLATLDFISASHDYRYSLNRLSRVLTIYFDSIFLPDNKTNEIEAHGFAKFKILPHEGLSEFSQINNSAQIYFDFNPPIYTNETKSIYVSDLSLLNSTYASIEKNIIISPNPIRDFLKIKCLTEEKINSINIYTVNGQTVAKPNIKNNHINISHLRSGIYIISVTTPIKNYVQKIIKI